MTTKHHVLAEKSSGYVVNLISKDLNPVHKAIVCHDSLLAPVEIFVVLCLLCKLVGWQTLGGVIFCIVLIAYQTLLGKVCFLMCCSFTSKASLRLRSQKGH